MGFGRGHSGSCSGADDAMLCESFDRDVHARSTIDGYSGHAHDHVLLKYGGDVNPPRSGVSVSRTHNRFHYATIGSIVQNDPNWSLSLMMTETEAEAGMMDPRN